MKSLLSSSDPRRAGPPWAVLALGVWLFWGALAPKTAGAVDSNSPMFQPTQGAAVKSAETGTLPLPDEKPQPAPGFWSTFLRLVSALLLTLALLIGTVWGLKILWQKRGWEGADQGDRPIKILSTAYLAPRKSVHLVEVGRRILVVGSGNGEVAALDVITDPEEVEQIRQAARAAVGGFPEVLKKVWNRQESGRSHEEARRLAEEGREAIGGFVEKVRNLSPKSKSGPKAGGGEE